MSAPFRRRLRWLLTAVRSYATGWRLGLVAVVVGIAGVFVGTVTGVAVAGVGAAVATAVVLGAVLVLLANQESRLRHRLAELPGGGTSPAPANAVTPAVGGPPAPTEVAEPLVSVVVVARNEARFVATALESLRAQTLREFECIVVDDASTDQTLDRVLDVVGDDPRFRVVTLDGARGPAMARNLGIARCRAPYVAFLDGDDFLYPDALAMRLEALLGHEDEPWVAGTYCQWVNVPETATLGAEPPAVRTLPIVSWLRNLTDAPFIVSAPLLRAEVIRSMGGFPDLPTAEDAAFWNRLLRAGYVVLPVDRVGVAYRAKASSLYRRSAPEHALRIVDAFAANAEVADGLPGRGPYPYEKPCTEYLWELTRVRRLLGALANALEAGDRSEADTLAAEVASRLDAYHLWELPLDEVIRGQATRVARHLSSPAFELHRDRVVAEMERMLSERVDRLAAEIRDRVPRERTEMEVDVPARPVRPVRRLRVTPELLDRSGSPIEGRVILMPSATYHVAETGPLAEQLEARGVECVVMVSDRRWPLVEKPQAAYDTPVLGSVEGGEWLRRAAAVVVMNDWGEEYKEYVELANAFGVPTFAKVEGVQDFRDDDVSWDRRAYQRARWILAQGRNDVEALPMKDTIVVSSSRLERIWLEPPRPPGPRLAVVNLNFTYGVLDDARDLWLSTAIEACERVDLPYVVSLHPAERDRWSGTLPVADAPIRHLLTEASVLISRFSTVPFEAMARGVPFVYHNPHGERVPTFKQPEGAFRITTSIAELADALVEAEGWQHDYRERAAAFFLRQVDVDPGRPSEVRAAEAIVERLSSR